MMPFFCSDGSGINLDQIISWTKPYEGKVDGKPVSKIRIWVDYSGEEDGGFFDIKDGDVDRFLAVMKKLEVTVE